MKRTTIIILLCTLFFANIADAKFSDEYKAKYPKKVKTSTYQRKNGTFSTSTDYYLFKRKSDGLSLIVCDLNGIKVCFLRYTWNSKKT
jgi:hypothetical protein